jgi:hypothetical protein
MYEEDPTSKLLKRGQARVGGLVWYIRELLVTVESWHKVFFFGANWVINIFL